MLIMVNKYKHKVDLHKEEFAAMLQFLFPFANTQS